jgi:hypothetical protein
MKKKKKKKISGIGGLVGELCMKWQHISFAIISKIIFFDLFVFLLRIFKVEKECNSDDFIFIFPYKGRVASFRLGLAAFWNYQG